MLNNFMNRIDFQKKALDASSLKQELIANNIANIETPGYKRKKLVFENLLSESMKEMKLSMTTTHKNHISASVDSLPYYIQTDNSFSERLDGNNVNIDVEMADQAKNSIKYNALISQTSGQLRRLKNAIKGGR